MHLLLGFYCKYIHLHRLFISCHLILRIHVFTPLTTEQFGFVNSSSFVHVVWNNAVSAEFVFISVFFFTVLTVVFCTLLCVCLSVSLSEHRKPGILSCDNKTCERESCLRE